MDVFVMVRRIQKCLAILGLSWALASSAVSLAGIWDLTSRAVAQNKFKVTYQHVESHLEFLTPSDNIVRLEDRDGTILVGEGYIVINRSGVRSYKNPEDHAQGIAPEFEFRFEELADEAHGYVPVKAALPRKGLEGIRIAIDILATHANFGDPIGTWKYDSFIAELQAVLGTKLREVGAEVSQLRPSIQITADTVDGLNANPPHIVISPQFNNDKQDCMLTFCGGNILKKEMAAERQRARFVEAALTGKHVFSAGLAACMTQHCQEKLKVEPLAWQKASFEGNARPLPISMAVRAAAKLPEDQGHFNGIAARNLLQNGLFAKAVVVPFPDMHWVRGQVAEGHEAEWIAQYAGVLVDAVLDYVSKHSKTFE